MTAITAEHIHQSNRIEGINDPAADRTSAAAWAYLERQPALTLEVVLQTHFLITIDQPGARPGELRRRDVRVGGVWVGGRLTGSYLPPAWELVSGMLADWLRAMQRWGDHDPVAMHVEFENVHPFLDGNGRTGRMLMWWHQLRLGQEPILLLADQREAYYQWFTVVEPMRRVGNQWM